MDKTHPHANYTIVLTDGTRIDALPTPALLSSPATGGHPLGRWIEAYESDPATDRYPAVWRLRDDEYDAAHNVDPAAYMKVVRIERKGW